MALESRYGIKHKLIELEEDTKRVRREPENLKIDDKMRRIGLKHGATVAKLGGAGNGGVMIFLCPENRNKVLKALQGAGAKTFIPKISPRIQ